MLEKFAKLHKQAVAQSQARFDAIVEETYKAMLIDLISDEELIPETGRWDYLEGLNSDQLMQLYTDFYINYET